VADEHATAVVTIAAPPKTIAARVARETGEGTAPRPASPQKGHAASAARTWREQPEQSRSAMVGR
jgi:hypothetical protein